MIPKWIHQTAPSQKSRWNSDWENCQKTVKENFKGFQYTLWTDEDLDNLVKTHFSWFYPVYSSYPQTIFRVDAARYMILYLYGGIYIDMDYEILGNFYAQLNPNKVNIVESPFKNVEQVQNSLMASPVRHPFWLEVLKEMASTSTIFFFNVLDATGPRMLDRVLEKTPNKYFTILPFLSFNPPPQGNIYNATNWYSRQDIKVWARHKCSASWRK